MCSSSFYRSSLPRSLSLSLARSLARSSSFCLNGFFAWKKPGSANFYALRRRFASRLRVVHSFKKQKKTSERLDAEKREKRGENIIFTAALERMGLKLKRSKIFRQRGGAEEGKEKKGRKKKRKKGNEWPVSNRLKICAARCAGRRRGARLERKFAPATDVNTDQTLKLLEFD